MVFATAVCFIVCHAGPADHFAAYAEVLQKNEISCTIYASGPALDLLKKKGVEIIPFDSLSEGAAKQLAERCARFQVILTDVGHDFATEVQEAFQGRAIAYYDNPEAFVAGGYSEKAAEAMRKARCVFFANKRFSKEPIFANLSEEILLSSRKGIGFYPRSLGESILHARKEQRGALRNKLFAFLNTLDQGQTLFAYLGGNNTTYFETAWPQFLRALQEAQKVQDLSSILILLQQHPGAKEKGLDWIQAQNLPKTEGSAQILLSFLTTPELLTVADAVIYAQTSLGPQFAYAEIPTIQMMDPPYQDVLVTHQLCSTATSGDTLLKALNEIIQGTWRAPDLSALDQAIGFDPEWEKHLVDAVREVAQEDTK